MSINWNIGIDAGATKTSLHIHTSKGYILKNIGPPANLHNLSLSKAIDNIKLTFNNTIKKHSHLKLSSKAESACIGWSGLDSAKDRETIIHLINKRSFLPSKRTIIVNDAYIALRSVKRVQYGVCLIAGTGAQCYGITHDGNEAMAGDWGYLLGDQGSGFKLGQLLIGEAMKEYDGRLPRTKLSQAVCKHFNISNLDELIHLIYTNHSVSKIASTTQILENETLQQLPSVRLTTQQIIDEMILSTSAVMSRLLFKRLDHIPLVAVGGLFNLRTLIFNPFKDKLHQLFPQLKVIRPQHKPVIGAIHIASQIDKGPTQLPLTTIILSQK